MYLLDTNIVSDLIRNPQGAAAGKLAGVGETNVATSIVVAAELRFGAIRKGSELSIGVQTGPTIGVQKGTTWRRCAGVDAGRRFRAGAGVGRA